MKKLAISLIDTNLKKIKDNHLQINSIALLLKILSKQQIKNIIMNDSEYINYKTRNKKNFEKFKYNLLPKQVYISSDTYNKLLELKEELNISKNFIINKLIEKYL